ncbi:hypothetical protein D3C80_1254270 [compost metagenome]
MVIHTHAGGQRQRLEDTPFIFDKERVLAGRGVIAGTARQVDRIFQLIVTPFATQSQQLTDFTQRQHVFPVHGSAFRGDRAAVSRIFVIDFFTVNFQFAVAHIPAAIVAQRIVLAIQAVLVERVRVAILTVVTVSRGKIMIFVWRPGEFHITTAAGKAFNARRFAGLGSSGFLLIVFFTLREASEGFQPQNAVHQRTAGVELAIIGIATIAVVLDGGVRRQRTGPFLTNFFGDDVHHPAQRIGTIQ